MMDRYFVEESCYWKQERRAIVRVLGVGVGPGWGGRHMEPWPAVQAGYEA